MAFIIINLLFDEKLYFLKQIYNVGRNLWLLRQAQ